MGGQRTSSVIANDGVENENSMLLVCLRSRWRQALQLELKHREGLPDALKVLLAEYPREGWESSDNFGGLIQFWLERHMMFRKIMTALLNESERGLDGNAEAQAVVSRISRYGSMLVGELHGHHNIEDMHYFPQLRLLDDRIAHGFDLLDSDHHALDGMIETFTSSANDVIKAAMNGGRIERELEGFRSSLIGFQRDLDRHLIDEEDLIVPVLLKHSPAGLV